MSPSFLSFSCELFMTNIGCHALTYQNDFVKVKQQWYLEISVINAQLVEMISDKTKYSRIFRSKRKILFSRRLLGSTDHADPSCFLVPVA